ncbi:hypothetical protein [Acanthopleuribacter pedis]|uniref:Outer membrane lipoprotein-sorting protein n=1 Tax=Acanthopleuribacter pedis TaxID=442870 RepID=A0A8J7U5E2_9BACT|nr:hypothetical protein [Acanthopleuribacter pedis]MBO1322458.1 hypothetical protein [Acanthopleuribacter pedis]
MQPKNVRYQLTLLFIALLTAPTLFAGDAAKVLDNVAKAMGGDDLEDVKSVVMTGNVKMPQQMNGKVEFMMKEGGMSKLKMNLTANGMNMVAEQGCNGDQCYDSNPMMGARLLEGQEKEQFQLSNDLRAAKEWRKYFKKVDYLGKETLNGKDVHKIHITTNAGIEMTQFVDAASNLVLKSVMTTQGPMGQMKVDSFYEDYKTIHKSIQFPMVTRINMMGQEVLMTFESFEVNQEIPDSVFAFPPSLQEAAGK